MFTFIVLLIAVFLIVMAVSYFATLAFFFKNSVARRWNARRPRETVEIVYGEVIEEDVPQLGAGR